MFVPESYNLGLAMALGALCCWGSWSVTLVLASPRMQFQLYYLDFSVFFLLTGVLVGLAFGGKTGGGGAAYGFSKSWSEEVAGGHSLPCYLWAMFGGIIWNVANVLLCKGIAMMGNAVGFPLCVGLGMVTGAIVAYVNEPKSNLAFLIPGILVALCGVFTVGFLSYRKEQELGGDPVAEKEAAPAVLDSAMEEREVSSASSGGDSASGSDVESDDEALAGQLGGGLLRKVLICVVGGLFLGLSNVGVGKATGPGCAMSPYANQSYFALGVFASSLVLIPLVTWFPLEGSGPSSSLLEVLAQHRGVALKDHCLAFLGGFILCSGFFFFNLGNKPLGMTITYCIGQSAPLVGILWGTFFFREFRGTTVRVWSLIPLVCCFFAAGIALLAAAG